MEKIKGLLKHIKGFACMSDFTSGLIFASGFFVGSQFTEVFGAIFAAVVWAVASFTIKKVLKRIKMIKE
tara:strand:+ start:5577 stop:5783 length:207 start_codon:yes stop_codon:yes gene_type:complete